MVLNVAVLISGGGSNLQALLAAAANPDYPARIVCVGADRDAAGLTHAQAAGIPTFTVRPRDFADRAAWGEAFAAQLRAFGMGNGAAPDSRWLVVSAGLMRVLPPAFVREFSPRLINTHPALLPLFPGAHAVADAVAAGATETGCTVHIIDSGVDTGPVLRQARVPILPGDDVATVHERIKQVERPLLVATVREIAEGTLELLSPHPAQQEKRN